jgi:hypothetical protein
MLTTHRFYLLTVFSVKKWLGRQTNLNDLASLDEELYQGLIKLKQYDGNVEDLALTFTLDVDGACLEPFPQMHLTYKRNSSHRLWSDGDGRPRPQRSQVRPLTHRAVFVFGARLTLDSLLSASVAKENRLQYIDLVASYKLNAQIDKQCSAFFRTSSRSIVPLIRLTFALFHHQLVCRTSSTRSGSAFSTSVSSRCWWEELTRMCVTFIFRVCEAFDCR